MLGVKMALKVMLTGLGLTLIAIGVGGTFITAQLQSTLTRGAGEAMTRTFDQDASVGAVYIDPIARALVLADLRLDNPEGFSKGPMLEAKSVYVEPRLDFLFRDEPAIKSIRIKGADIFYRYGPIKGSNIGAFADKLEERSQQVKKKITVGELVAEDAKFHFANDWLPTELIGVRLVDIKIEDLGEGGGITPAQVTTIFLRSIVKEAVTLKGLLSGGSNDDE